MALIKCLECGKEISDKAAVCPNCGAPVEKINKEHEKHLFDNIEPSKPILTDSNGMIIPDFTPKTKKNNIVKNILIGICVVIVLLIIIGSIGGSSNNQNPDSATSTKQETPKVVAPEKSEEFKKGSDLNDKDNTKEAAVLFKNGEAKGCLWSKAALGIYSCYGLGGAKKDIKKGLQNIKVTADQNVPIACRFLGDIYLKGMFGVPKDAEKGLLYSNRAIDLGLNDVLVTVASYYEEGNTALGEDYEKALEYYKKARSVGEKGLDNKIYNLEHLPDYYWDIVSIVKEYTENEVAADNKYKGKEIQFSGIIDTIGKDVMDSMYITLKKPNQWEFRNVQFFFENEHSNELANLKKGQTVTIQGRIDGLFGNVLVKNCWIVKE